MPEDMYDIIENCLQLRKCEYESLARQAGSRGFTYCHKENLEYALQIGRVLELLPNYKDV